MRTFILSFCCCIGRVRAATGGAYAGTGGIPRGETWEGYNIVDSVETGYRFARSAATSRSIAAASITATASGC